MVEYQYGLRAKRAKRSRPTCAMAIELPDFDSLNLIQLAVCATPSLEDERVSRWLDSLVHETARQPGEGDVLYGRRFGETGGEDHGHFHLELAKKSIFRKPPKAEPGLERLLDSSLGPLDNMSVRAFVLAKFKVPRSELPKESFMEVLLGVAVEKDETELRLTGGEMSVIGETPFSLISWSAEEEEVEVQIKGELDVTLNSSLLVQCAECMRDGLNALVLDKGNGE